MTSRQQRRASERQARKDANRQNAQFSTGPKTPEGKLASSRNSFQHGLYSKQLVIPGEDPAQLDALRTALQEEHQPQTPTEELLVNELAEQYWRLKRMRRIEASLLGAPLEELERSFRLLPMVQRTMASAERGFHKALKALHDVQKQRQRQRKEVGFVPQKPEQLPTPVGQLLLAGYPPGLGIQPASALDLTPPLTSPTHAVPIPEPQTAIRHSSQ